MKRQHPYFGLAVTMLLIGVIGLVGSCDYEDHIKNHIFKCQMIDSGSWPDYDGSKKKGNCPKEDKENDRSE